MKQDPLNDGISSVKLLDWMGDDLRVVNTARVSMRKESFEFSLEDEKLIAYLARNGHWTPFSQCMATFRIKMPIFVARQWYRSNMGITRNEESRRYVDHDPQFFMPAELRLRAESVKQGSSDETVPTPHGFNYAVRVAFDTYRELLADGVAPELARMVLPQNTYIEFIETASLAAYARVCKLRLHPHAQREIQAYAQAVANEMAGLFPVSWKNLIEVKE